MADPCQLAGATELLTQTAGNGSEQGIAIGMAEQVVDGGKLVDIQQGQDTGRSRLRVVSSGKTCRSHAAG